MKIYVNVLILITKMSYKYKRSSTKYGTSSKRRAYGQFKAAAKGNDSLSFVIKSNHVFTSFYNPDGEKGTAAIPVWEVLARNGNFSSLKSMYDQVKIDGVKCNITVTDAVTSITEISKINNITIYTAWDRTGLSQSQAVYIDYNNNEIKPSEFDTTSLRKWRTKIGCNIVNASQAKKSTLNSYQRWNSYMTIYPSLMNEKSQYISTGDIRTYLKNVNYESGIHELSETYNSMNVNTFTSDNNPVIPFESSNIRFKPTLLVGVFSNSLKNGGVTQFAETSPVIFNAEFSISVTFKNLKANSVGEVISSGDDMKVDNHGELRFTQDTLVNDRDKDGDEDMGTQVLVDDDGMRTVQINSLINNPLVTYNENNLPYFTSIGVTVPVKQVLQGAVIRSKELGVKDVETTDEGVLLSFTDSNNRFRVIEPSEDTVTLNPGDELLAVTEVNGSNEVVKVRNPVREGTSTKIIHFAQACKAAVLTGIEVGEYIYNGATFLYDMYKKVSVSVPTILLPLRFLIGVADNDDEPEDVYIDYNSIRTESTTDNNLDQNNAVMLPNWLYVCDWIP